MPSPTRKRWLQRRKEIRAQRKIDAKAFGCRGMIESRGKDEPCEWRLVPHKEELESIHTCHRCGTIHIMTIRGWRTEEEARAQKRVERSLEFMEERHAPDHNV